MKKPRKSFLFLEVSNVLVTKGSMESLRKKDPCQICGEINCLKFSDHLRETDPVNLVGFDKNSFDKIKSIIKKAKDRRIDLVVVNCSAMRWISGFNEVLCSHLGLEFGESFISLPTTTEENADVLITNFVNENLSEIYSWGAVLSESTNFENLKRMDKVVECENGIGQDEHDLIVETLDLELKKPVIQKKTAVKKISVRDLYG